MHPWSAPRARSNEPGGRRATKDALFVEGSTGRVLHHRDIDALASTFRAVSTDLCGGPVGVCVDDPLTLIACVVAGWESGVTVAPMNAGATGGEIASHCDAAGIATVITDAPDACTAGLERVEQWFVDPWSASLTRVRPVEALRNASRTNAALVLTSSGTTGTPKVIPLTREQVFHTAAAVVSHHRIEPDDVGYSPLPLFHINALVVGVAATLLAGATLVVDRRFSARGYWPTVARYGVTWCNAVPAIITILASSPAPEPHVARGVRFIRSASAPLAPAVKARFESHCGVGVLETYGMTEAASMIAANPLDPALRRAGSVGRAVALEVRIVGSDERPVPAGSVGRVQIRGASVASEGWLTTGDVGHLDADGFLYLAGREDDVINRGGEKVYPREIEDVLLADSSVHAAVVVAREHALLGAEPVAYVLTDAETGTGAGELVELLTQRCENALSRYKRPAAIIVTHHLPAGATGKVRRREVQRLLSHAGPAA